MRAATGRLWILLGLALTALATPRALADDPPRARPLPPDEALKAFKLEDGLALDQVLAEPEIAQPVFLTFDERGRLWVVEYRQYPEPAGLTMVSRDNVWRAVYDKVPAPPPNHVRGKDRISIHEDADGDGTFERHRVFVDGLNIATACAFGRGGVWVLNPPYLLFYPDANRDDVPDGDPEVHLEGFGLEDTHSVVNSLCWGPDGWLYAAQGSTVSGRVRRFGTKEPPVHSMGQLIWRYHPETRRYEVFAEGGGNAFGVEVDAKGRIFSGHNGGDTRGFHYVQGGYSRKGFDKHGPLSNPYTFGYFDAMKHPNVPRFTHAFVIEEAGGLPPRYRGKLLGVAPLLSHVVASEVIPDGSTFRTRDVGFPLTTSDPWFRPVDIKLGPDGAVYLADWYDGQVNHYRNHEGKIDRANGRVYRLRAADGSPRAAVDLGAKSTDALIAALDDPNRWVRQTALRLLGDRKDRSAIGRLRAALAERTGQPALEALWGLNLCGGLDEAAGVAALGHADPHVRRWAVRLLGDDPARVSGATAAALASLAAREPDVEARSQLACTARRLPARLGLPVVRALLARDEDADDPHVPLLLWWAIEAKAESDRTEVLALFRDPAAWTRPIVRGTIVERAARRYAAAGTRQDFQTCADLLALAPDADAARRVANGVEAALSGRAVAGLPAALAEALAKYQGEDGATILGLRRGEPSALDSALRVLSDGRADRDRRLRLARALGELDRPAALPTLIRLATDPSDPALQAAALAALPRHNDPAVGEALLAALPRMTDDVRGPALEVLVSRAPWALRLAEAVEAGRVDRDAVPDDLVRRLRRLKDGRLADLAGRLWPGVRDATPAELQREIERLAVVVRSGPGDPRAGERHFARACASCHALFGRGGRVGPELTTYRRDDLDTMLLNVVNPNAEVREGYTPYLVATADGRSLNGLLVDQDPALVVLRGPDGRDVPVRRDEIDELRAAPGSIMPEGLLKGLSDADVRDLFAYLRGNQPPK